MKPFAVLGLVAVAVVALFFVMFNEPVEPIPGGGGLGRSQVETDTPDAPDLGAPSLAADSSNRTPAKAPNVERAAVEIPGGEVFAGAFDNGLRGLLNSPDGVPVVGAKVILSDKSINSGFEPLQIVIAAQTGERGQKWTAITDAEGRFQFSSLPPSSTFSVKAAHPDFGQAVKSNIVIRDNAWAEIIVNMKAGHELRGRVMDDDTGQPIVGAQLALRSVFASMAGTSTGDDPTTLTDEQGVFHFRNIANGNLNLTVTAEDYGSLTRNNLSFNAATPDPLTQDFRLSRGLRLRGRVVSPDLMPIVGASITATSYETAQISTGKAITDTDGYFEISNLADGTFMVVANAKNFSDQRMTRVKLSDPDVQIVMSRQGGVVGSVVTHVDGSVITKFRAQVRSVAPGTVTYGRAVTMGNFDDPNGKFELGGLEPGSYAIQVESIGYAPTFSKTFTVSQGIITPDVQIQMGQGGTISGRVVDAVTGQPVQGAVVKTLDNSYVESPFTKMLGALVPRSTTDRKVRTANDGSFTIDLITATTYQLQINHPDYIQKHMKDLYVSEGQTQDLGSIRLPKGATIRGTVYDASGAPLAGARISLTGGGGGMGGLAPGYPNTVHTNEEGRYLLNNVRAGTWQLAAVRPPSDTSGGPFFAIIDMKNSEVMVSVGDGQELVRNLSLSN